MSEIPATGQIPPEIFNRIIRPHLGVPNESIIAGPHAGADIGIAVIGDAVVAVKSRPLFILPAIGWERSAWLTVQILASDCVTSGLKPTYLCIDLNLPLAMTREQLTLFWDAIHQECLNLGIAVITGHTARYEGCSYPMVGGTTIIGMGKKDEYLSPRFIRPGDKIIITKGPAIQAAGLFAAARPDFIEKEFGKLFAAQAASLFIKISAVADGLTVIATGVRDNGVTAIQAAGEYGLWGALWRLGQTSGCGLRVVKESIVIEDGVREICALLGIDPYAAISAGTLVITCRPHRAEAVLDALARNNVKASIAGELTSPGESLILVEGGQPGLLRHPDVDPFWAAFEREMAGRKA